ncbi:MAG: hypothetical protein COA74_10655 [Gammaproteobacteria bacterium]|nr:MAG: hypothetical protein COA74_10655 [Gammaproteobacteria bacterium]
METLLYLAAFMTFFIGITHSVLGEKYILIRLFKRDNLPKLFGGTEFTKLTLRFAWHITTIAWWGFAAILILLAEKSFNYHNLAMVIAVTFLVSSVITIVMSKGQHYAGFVFLFIGGVSLYAAVT